MLPEISRLRHQREERHQLHAIPMTGAGTTQPSITCDPTKSPGTGQLGTIVVRECRVGMWTEEEVKWFVGDGERRVWKAEVGEERADMIGLLATQKKL